MSSVITPILQHIYLIKYNIDSTIMAVGKKNIFTVKQWIFFIWMVKYTLLRSPCYYRFRSILTFNTALIQQGTDSTCWWKHCSQISLFIGLIESHSCCRSVGGTSRMQISHFTTEVPKVLYWIEIWWLQRPFEFSY